MIDITATPTLLQPWEQIMKTLLKMHAIICTFTPNVLTVHKCKQDENMLTEGTAHEGFVRLMICR